MRDMRELDTAELAEVVIEQQYPLLFATVSGAHLYGFPSRDSDVDLRGVHVLPAEEVVGLRTGPETLTHDWIRNGAEMDLVTHDVAKFVRQLLPAPAYLPHLIAAKAEHEHGGLAAAAPELSADRIDDDLALLHAELDAAEASSRLPDSPSAEPALHDLLVRLRLSAGTG